MLPVDRPDILREGLQALSRFAQKTSVRGRFVALYLGPPAYVQVGGGGRYSPRTPW